MIAQQLAQAARSGRDPDLVRSLRESMAQAGFIGLEADHYMQTVISRARRTQACDAETVGGIMVVIYGETGDARARLIACTALQQMGESAFQAGCRLDKARGLPCPSHHTLGRSERGKAAGDRFTRWVGSILGLEVPLWAALLIAGLAVPAWVGFAQLGFWLVNRILGHV